MNKQKDKKSARLTVTGSVSMQRIEKYEAGELPLDLADMLRYDDCTIADGTFEVYDLDPFKCFVQYKWTCIVEKDYIRWRGEEQFTIGRWSSFGIVSIPEKAVLKEVG